MLHQLQEVPVRDNCSLGFSQSQHSDFPTFSHCVNGFTGYSQHSCCISHTYDDWCEIVSPIRHSWEYATPGPVQSNKELTGIVQLGV